MRTSIVVTGSRHFDDYAEITRAMGIEIKDLVDKGYTEITVRHGAAKGADELVVEFINKSQRSLAGRGIRVSLEAYPPNITQYGSPQAFHKRNQQMVDDSEGGVCVAFLKKDEGNRGTLGTIARARKAKMPVKVYGAVELDR